MHGHFHFFLSSGLFLMFFFLKYFKAILFADFRVNDPTTTFIVSDHMDGRISHWGKRER